MQLAEAIALSKKNEELLQQLINQTNAQNLPLCIRHLTTLQKLDMQHLVGILLSIPSLQKDTLIDLAADASSNRGIERTIVYVLLLLPGLPNGKSRSLSGKPTSAIR